ncbi:MAG: efflux RND transporter periplasmic adaptor subunit [Acidobacteriota bacterium]
MSPSPQRSRPLLMIALGVGALLFGIVLGQFLPADLLGLRGTSAKQPASQDDPDPLWTCGMHPHVIEHGPGQCPICGMDLTPVRGSDGDFADDHPAHPAADAIRIEPEMVQNMNVRTAEVTRRDLNQPIRTVGYLEFDQQRMVTVTTKYKGWVEKVYVNYVGEEVRRGQPLFEIYSPELVQTERELLSALEFVEEMRDAPADALERAESMVESARVRLTYWDIAPQQIARLEETGEVFRTLSVAAPSGGLVMKRMAGLEGMAVEPGMELFHIADLSNLWVSVELFESQLAAVREGTEALIELSYFPGETFRGTVRYLEPELSEETRTMRAMVEVPNPRGRLRKGMYATVELNPIQVPDALVVPSHAVLRTGERNVVVEALGEGRFAPREIVLGHRADGYTEILSGLDEGTRVVTSAQFLLDSESTLREAVQKMVAERSERPATAPLMTDPAMADPSPAAPDAAHEMTDPSDHSGHGDHSEP